ATAPPGSPLHFVDAELTGKQGGRAPLHPVPPLHTAVIGADLDPPSRPQLPPQNVFHHAVCFFQRIVHLTLAVRAQGLGTAVHGRGRVVPVVLGTALGALHDSAVECSVPHSAHSMIPQSSRTSSMSTSAQSGHMVSACARY